MKKSIFIVSITLLFCACHAQNNNKNKAVIDRINAIVAFEIICRTYPGSEECPPGKTKEDFNKRCKSADNVDVMVHFLKNEKKLSKLLNIAESIKSYGLSKEFESSQDIKRYYEEQIRRDFEKVTIEPDFLKNVEKTAQDYDFNIESHSETQAPLKAEGDDSDKDYETLEQLNQRIDSETNGNLESETFKLGAKILLALSLALLITLIVYFFLYNKAKKDRDRYKDLCDRIGRVVRTPNIDSLPDIVRDKIEKNEEYARLSLSLQNTISGLKQEISDYERTIRETEYKYRQNSSTNNVQTGSSGYMHQNVGFAETIKDLTGTEMYLGLPSDNAFNNVIDVYRAGKTLYKLTYTSNDTAIYEFINKPETIQFARQSRTRFLECACIIENDDVPVFDSIETIEVGKLEKNNDVWEIISKARIRLS